MQAQNKGKLLSLLKDLADVVRLSANDNGALEEQTAFQTR